MNTNAENLTDLSVPLVISFENNFKENKNSMTFKQTLDKCNWEYVFIGEGEKWEGFGTKIYNYYKYLKELPEEKMCILSDSRDVLCTRSPLTFMNAIQKITDINNKIIISAEGFLLGCMDWTNEDIRIAINKDPQYFWQGIPLKKYWEYYNISSLPINKYVNSGLITGKVKNLCKSFEWIIKNNFTDDQHGFANYTNEFPENVYLDYSAKILHTSSFCVYGGYYSDKQKYLSPTFAELLGLSSYFLHLPGLNISKGQKYIYELIVKLLELGIFKQKDDLANLYGIVLNDTIEYNYFDRKLN